MGEEDHLKAAVEALGSLRLWQLAIKPGRRRGARRARDADGRPVRPSSACPGNPVAAIAAFSAWRARSCCASWALADVSPPRIVCGAGFAIARSRTGANFCAPGLTPGEGGDVTVLTFPAQGSGILSSLLSRRRAGRAAGDVDQGRARQHGGFPSFRRDRLMKLLYFAWLRAKLGKGSEEARPAGRRRPPSPRCSIGWRRWAPPTNPCSPTGASCGWRSITNMSGPSTRARRATRWHSFRR